MRARRAGIARDRHQRAREVGRVAVRDDARLVVAHELPDAVHGRGHHRQPARCSLVGRTAESLVDGRKHEQVRRPVAALDLCRVAEETHALADPQPVGERRVGLIPGADHPQKVGAAIRAGGRGKGLDSHLQPLERSVLLVHEQRHHGGRRDAMFLAEPPAVLHVRSEAVQVDAPRHHRYPRAGVETSQIRSAALGDADQHTHSPSEPPPLERQGEALTQLPADRAGAALDRIAGGGLVIGGVAEGDRVEVDVVWHDRHRADGVHEVGIDARQAQAADCEERHPPESERPEHRRRHPAPVDQRAQRLVQVHRHHGVVEALVTERDHALQFPAQPPADERHTRPRHGALPPRVGRREA